MSNDIYTGIYSEMQKVCDSLIGVAGLHYNATLTFLTSSSTTIIQDDYGNYVTDTAPVELIVQAKLRPIKNPMIEPNPGVDEARTYMEGEFVSPAELDGSFYTRVKCVITQNNVDVEGHFHFVDYIPDPLEENFDIAVALGQRVTGYFERNHTNM